MPRTRNLRRPITIEVLLEDPYGNLPVSTDLPAQENRIRQFVNRWVWNRDRALVAQELRDLLQVCTDDADAPTCPLLICTDTERR